MNGVEILVVTHKRECIEKCVNSILPYANCSILVIVNGCNSAIVEYLQDVKNAYPPLRYFAIEAKVEKSKARNMAIEKATGDILYFLDDDAYFSKDNVSLLLEKFSKYTGIGFVGGPNLTPADSCYFQKAVGYTLTALFTAFKMRLRYTKGKRDELCDDRSLMLCNLAFRRSVIEEDKIYFDRRLYYNEENLFLQQYMKRGRKMLYCPELYVYHERRKTAAAFAEQVFRSGEGRAKMTMIMPGSLSPVHLIPSLFTAYLLSSLFVSSGLYQVPLVVYLMLCVASALGTVNKRKENVSMFAVLLVMPFLAHVSYGAGFVWGFGRYLACRK